jgi:hypothetical protein
LLKPRQRFFQVYACTTKKILRFVPAWHKCRLESRFADFSQWQNLSAHPKTDGALMQDEIVRLEELYSVSNPQIVEKFTNENPHLYPILIDAYEHIINIFGKALLGIELSHETEIDERNEHNDLEYLAVAIKTNLPTRESHKLQDRFDDEWWLDVEEDLIVISVDVPQHS